MAERAPALTRTYKVAEIAERLNVTVKMVYGWIEDEQLVALQLPGRRRKDGRPGRVAGWRVRAEDLEDFVLRIERWRAQNSQSPATDSDAAANTGPSVGPTRKPRELGPFQQGRLMKLVPKSGGTNS